MDLAERKKQLVEALAFARTQCTKWTTQAIGLEAQLALVEELLASALPAPDPDPPPRPPTQISLS